MNLTNFLVLLFVAANIAYVVIINRSRLHFFLEIWRAWTWRTLLESLVAIGVVICSFVFLYTAVPFLRFGWYGWLLHEDGNIMVGAARDTFDSKMFAIFLAGFILLLPLMAEIEEEAFRRPIKTRRGLYVSSIGFGFMHLLMGIPLAAGLAISASGIVMGRRYRIAYLDHLRRYPGDIEGAEKIGVRASTTLHSLYNTVLFGIALLVTLIEMM